VATPGYLVHQENVLRDGAEIMSRFIPACMIALAREYFSISLTHCLKNLAA
jgi:hypothetical protein